MINDDKKMERLLKLHSEFKRIRFSLVHDNFSNSEFFTLCRICGVATDFDRKKNPVGIGIPMKQLSDGMRVTPAMISKTVNSLEERGCVERKYDGGDRRSVKVCITEKGFELWKNDDKSGRNFAGKVFSEFGEEKTEMFFELSEELLGIAIMESNKYTKKRKV